MTQFDLRQQDCVKGMSRLSNEHVDLVVTSPPYNLGVEYKKYSDRQDRQSYLRWCREWAGEVRRVLKSNGSFFLNIGSAPSNPMLPHEIAMELRDLFVLQNTIHWIKSVAIDTPRPNKQRGSPHLPPSQGYGAAGNPLPLSRWERRTRSASEGEGVGKGEEDAQCQVRLQVSAATYGHFKPISSKRFLNDCHEYIFHFTKTGRVEIDRLGLGVPYQDKSNIARWRHTRGSDRRCRGNTWFIPYETIQSRAKERPHPATFPVKLAEWCIRLHGVSRVHTMLDPFLGIGNSAVAAQRCGVKEFIGFEIDETYLAEAKRRLAL